MSLIRFVVRTSVRRPFLIFGCIAVLLAASLWSARSLGLKTSNLDLIDRNVPEVQRFLSFARLFGTPNTLVVVFEGRDVEQLRRAVDTAGPLLRSISEVRKVLDKLPVFEGEAEPRYEYLSSDDSRMLYVFVQPENISTEVSEITPLVEKIEATLTKALGGIDGVQVGYTGIPRYSLDDQQVIQRDMSVLSVVSLVLVSLLFIFSFHSVRRPLLAVLTLVVSVLLTLGVVALYPGHLTLLSAPFAMMIFGLGIDYGIHIINRVEEDLAQGESEKSSAEEAVIGLGRTLLTACGTTVAVFFVLMLSSFLGFRELGFIAGVGLLICVALMFTLFPALLAVFSRPAPPPAAPGCDALSRAVLFFQRPRWAVALLALTVAVSLLHLPRFDSDYLNLQPEGSDSVRLERAMVQHSKYSPYFAAFVVDTIDEAASLAALLRTYDEIGEVRSLSDFVSFPKLSEQEKQELMKKPPEEWPVPPDADIPQEYEGIFDSDDGRFAVYAYPAGSIWNPQVEEDFLRLVRDIDPDAAGMPLLGNAMISRTKRALHETAIYAFIALLVILAADFRRPLLVLFTAIPPVFAIIWMHAVMRLFGLAYNPLNIMALPIVIGIAVDDGVHITHRFISERGDMARTLLGSGRSVLLTTLTTLAAFACIAATEHRGLRSFSIILSIGVTAAFVHSVTVLPWLLERCRRLIIGDEAARSGAEPEEQVQAARAI